MSNQKDNSDKTVKAVKVVKVVESKAVKDDDQDFKNNAAVLKQIHDQIADLEDFEKQNQNRKHVPTPKALLGKWQLVSNQVPKKYHDQCTLFFSNDIRHCRNLIYMSTPGNSGELYTIFENNDVNTRKGFGQVEMSSKNQALFFLVKTDCLGRKYVSYDPSLYEDVMFSIPKSFEWLLNDSENELTWTGTQNTQFSRDCQVSQVWKFQKCGAVTKSCCVIL